jgi:ribonuclease P protein component
LTVFSSRARSRSGRARRAARSCAEDEPAYTSERRAEEVAAEERGPRDVQADVSAEQPPPVEDTRVPGANAHARRSRHHRAAPLERPDEALGLIDRFVAPLDVHALLQRGSPVHGERVVAFVAPGSGAVAFIAGRRVGGAVQRNRARRILRAAWRQVAEQADDAYDIAWVARAGIAGAKTQDLIAEMTQLLRHARAVPA